MCSGKKGELTIRSFESKGLFVINSKIFNDHS